MKKVSIILPVYNVQAYISECLDSILGQTYSNLEVILVDDGSTDSSGKICDEYSAKDERIRVIHKTNSGVSEARNSGLGIACGDYIAFADSDDKLDRDMIEKLVSALEQNQADASFCRFHIDIIPDDKKQFYQAAEKEYGDGGDALCCMMTAIAYGTMVWNKLFERKLIFDSDNTYVRFDETLKCGEDEVWLIDVVQKAAKVVYLKEELYYWRVRQDSAYRDKRITDTKVTDVIAQEKALEHLADKASVAYERIMERLNQKVYSYQVQSYVNAQYDYVERFEVFRKKYSRYWFASDRVALKSKIKRRIIEMCIKLKLSRRIVKRLMGEQNI